MTETLHLTSTPDVRSLAARLASASAIALDGLEATVDPLAGPDLSSLWAALVAGPILVVHAGAHDLDILHRAAGRIPERVFDTQVAGAFLGFGDATGYGNLVGAALKERVRGGEGYTDWSRRPLSSEQAEYALEDIRHLLALWRALDTELERRGRREWGADEITRRLESVGEDGAPVEAWRRVTDARKLRG